MERVWISRKNREEQNIYSRTTCTNAKKRKDKYRFYYTYIRCIKHLRLYSCFVHTSFRSAWQKNEGKCKLWMNWRKKKGTPTLSASRYVSSIVSTWLMVKTTDSTNQRCANKLWNVYTWAFNEQTFLQINFANQRAARLLLRSRPRISQLVLICRNKASNPFQRTGTKSAIASNKYSPLTERTARILSVKCRLDWWNGENNSHGLAVGDRLAAKLHDDIDGIIISSLDLFFEITPPKKGEKETSIFFLITFPRGKENSYDRRKTTNAIRKLDQAPQRMNQKLVLGD